jgi:ectoine hydroxylase-related dioxygenase (phytanoyl-CoA dioxygenase family)
MNATTAAISSTWVTGKDLKFPPLTVSNDLLNDHAALAAALERDGYLFFRDVLDPQAVADLRRAYVEELAKLGVVDANDPAVRYNGHSLDDLPKTPVSGVIEGIFKRAPWKSFVASPKVDALVRSVLGDAPYWAPILGYRVAKPRADAAGERLEYVHQDGFFNPGIPFINCWIPLVDMDPEVGGIAVAQGMHKGPTIHDESKPPSFPAMREAVPMSAWRRSDYHPGDLLMLHLDTPHSGITNISQDRFRMSMDIRMLPSSGELPVVGSIVEIKPDHVSVKDNAGECHTLGLDDRTYCRGKRFVSGARISSADAAAEYAPGDQVIVAHTGGRATVIRPASY